MDLQRKDCIFSCVYHAGNGDHVEGTSCGSKSKDDDVCFHWETHVVEWEVARKKNAMFTVPVRSLARQDLMKRRPSCVCINSPCKGGSSKARLIWNTFAPLMF